MRLLALSARIGAWLALSCVLLTGSALAQTGTSSITGTITDDSKSALPGVTITVTNASTGLLRTTASNGQGNYSVLALPPGVYNVKAELSGFKTTIQDKVTLGVDIQTHLDLTLGIGNLSETVEVTSEAAVINTADASMGNVINGTQVRQLPLEANNVVGLLSLQPGAVYVPNAAATDSRSGAVSGARADQSNVTLDGVDVNDPQYSNAYQSVLRVTLDSLQEFRVSTSNYGAESGRSSAAQVSLVTRSGSNQFHGSGNWVQRNTKFSSNDYFLKLSQLSAGDPNKAPKLDKKIFGGAVGGPIAKDRLFFFGNYERLSEDSETPVTRDIPSLSMRDGVLVYPCADEGACPGGSVNGFSASHSIPAGYYGLTPGDLALLDPLGIGPSRLASQYFQQYPTPNDPGIDGYNLVGYRFASPIKNKFNTAIGRIDYRASNNQTFFGRMNFQDDAIATASQFAGQAPRTTQKVKSRGVALGWDWVLGSNVVNTFRYGLTQIKSDTIGLQDAITVRFRNIDSFNALTATSGRDVPTHTFADDLSWVKGSHTLKVGTNIRITRMGQYTNAQSFHDPIANGSWVDGVGRNYMPGAGCGAACDAFPAVADGGQATYGDTFIPMLGIISEVDAYYNYNRDGSTLGVGDPVRRRFGSDEYEFYVQDTWRLGQDFTITGGLRYGLYSPPWEVNGLQVTPDIKLGDWFDQRAALMNAGRSTSDAPLVNFDLAGPANGKPGYYDWDKNNFAPRISAAWNPHAEGGLAGWLTGNGKLVVRGGYSLLYDRIGQALVTNFDSGGLFGLSTQLSSTFGGHNEDDPSVRFAGLDVLPPTLPDAPAGGFPQTPPSFVGQITTTALDGTIKTPYHHSYNFVVGRDLGRGFSFEGAYVGRKGHNLLVRRDAAQPADIKVGGVDYYAAATQLINAAHGIDRSASADAYAGIAPIQFWETLFPDAAGEFQGVNLTATQRMARSFNRAAPDFTTALYNADEFCSPACSSLGEFAFFSPQFDSLGIQSTIGRASYNAMQLSLRKRFTDGYQFDVNYTLSKAQDHGSQVEQSSTFTTFDNGGYTGFLLDSWNPDKVYGTADFDVRHQLNVNWITDLPFGHGRRFGKDMPGWADAVVGGWSVAGLARLTSGYPFSVFNCRQCWPTNWNLQGNASLVDPNRLPETKTTKNVIDGYPSVFANPEDAITYFRRDNPGEVGLRNAFRGDGYFSIDLSVSKTWTMPWSNDHKIIFRWDTFNLTNTPKFDVGQTDMFPDRASTFGRYNGTMSSCDGGAGRCMQFHLRYEF